MIKVWSNQPFPRYEISHEMGDDMCTVVLYADKKTVIMPDGDTAYCATLLCLNVAYKPNILQDVRDNYTEWMLMAFEDLLYSGMSKEKEEDMKIE